MAKKLSLLAAAAAVALTVPALASAGQVTNGSGVVYPLGTQITGASHNTTTTTEGLGTLECAGVAFDAELIENGPQAEAESVGAGTTETCSAEGNSVEVTDWTLINLKTTGYHESPPESGILQGTAAVAVTFVMHLPIVTCHFSGVLSGTYVVLGHTLHVNGFLEGGACGHSSFSGDYTLGKTGGGPVVLD